MTDTLLSLQKTSNNFYRGGYSIFPGGGVDFLWPLNLSNFEAILATLLFNSSALPTKKISSIFPGRLEIFGGPLKINAILAIFSLFYSALL